jgi:hypothetical protein
MTDRTTKLALALSAALSASFFAASAPVCAAPPPPVAIAAASYADLADLADSAPLVLRAQIRKTVAVEAARAPGLRSGWIRFYVEARTQALLLGKAPLGEALRYLVDVPLDSRGKPPKLKKLSVFLFARTVAGHPGELQLTAQDAQLRWDAAVETRLRGVLAELLAPGAPRRVTSIREAIHVPGTLAGEGETQIFLSTPDDEPASITVHRRPGEAASWSASFSEVLDAGGGAAPRETLAWYRLACFLPGSLPAGSNLSDGAAAREQAERDYRLVMDQMGSCPRTRQQGLSD